MNPGGIFRRLLACLLPIVMLPQAALAEQAIDTCDCLWQGDFSEVQSLADLVVSGTVAAVGKGNSIDLALEETLRGRELQPTIRIWLKARDYCRPPVSEFPPGSRWVMALHRIEEDVPGGFDPATPNISYGRIGDYRLSICGGYWLTLTEQWVTGNLVNAPRWDRAPKMTPVLLELVAAYVRGEVDRNALLEASREDPALRELMLDTREFLRRNQ